MMLFACGGEESANLDPQVIRVVDDEFSPKVIRVEPGTTAVSYTHLRAHETR